MKTVNAYISTDGTTVSKPEELLFVEIKSKFESTKKEFKTFQEVSKKVLDITETQIERKDYDSLFEFSKYKLSVSDLSKSKIEDELDKDIQYFTALAKYLTENAEFLKSKKDEILSKYDEVKKFTDDNPVM